MFAVRFFYTMGLGKKGVSCFERTYISYRQRRVGKDDSLGAGVQSTRKEYLLL